MRNPKWLLFISLTPLILQMPFAKAEEKCIERGQPAIRIVLMHYGSDLYKSDLDRVWNMLRTRFLEATGCQVRLVRVATAISPLKSEGSKQAIPPALRSTFGGSSKPSKLSETERKRLARLRYYYWSDGSERIVDELIKIASPLSRNRYDAIVALSAAQFEDLGFGMVNEMAVTEQPSEVAWSTPGGGTTVFESDARIVDELIHELGHYMGLMHAASECNTKPDPKDPFKFRRCCDASPNGKDIMSYCRKRTDVSEEFFYKFEACNQKKIKNIIIPKLLKHEEFRYERNPC